MNGVKGSIKDRIRSLHMRMRRKKEEKRIREMNDWKKEQQKSKVDGMTIIIPRKRHGNFSVFFHILFGIFLEIFTPKRIQNQNQTLETITIELQQITQNIKKIKEEKVLRIYEKKLNEQKKTIQEFNRILTKTKAFRNKNVRESYQNCIKSFLSSEVTLHEQKKVAVFGPTTIMEPIQKKEIGKTEVKKKELVRTVEQPRLKKEISVSSEAKISKSIEIENRSNSFIQPKEEREITISLEKRDYKKYIKETNKKMKQVKDKMAELKEESKKSFSQIVYYQFLSLYEYIYEELYQLEKEYQEISKDQEFQYLKNESKFYEIDSKNMLQNDTSILELMEFCQQSMIELKQKAKEKTTQKIKGKPVKSKKYEKKEEKKEQKKISSYLSLTEYNQLHHVILEDLQKQMIELSDFNQPKKNFIKCLSNMITGAALALLPIPIFPNKIVGLLTSSILMHNRIQTMKKMMHQETEVYEYGNDLQEQIQSKEDCIRQAKYHIQSSLSELLQIKFSFLNEYVDMVETNIEVKQTYEKLNALEDSLVQRELELDQFQNKKISCKIKKHMN